MLRRLPHLVRARGVRDALEDGVRLPRQRGDVRLDRLGVSAAAFFLGDKVRPEHVRAHRLELLRRRGGLALVLGLAAVEVDELLAALGDLRAVVGDVVVDGARHRERRLGEV